MSRPSKVPLSLLVLLLSACAPAPSGGTQTVPTSVASPLPSVAPTPAAAASAATPSTFTLTGVVLDDRRDPVPGADVAAAPTTGAAVTGKADASGVYRLSVAPGQYNVTATKAGWTARTKTADVQADTTLDFGKEGPKDADPYFLSNTPEVTHVEVEEVAPGGPLKLHVTLSEALPKASQDAFTLAFELKSGHTTDFLRTGSGGDYNLKTRSEWDVDGKVFTFSYDSPYLASGETERPYTAVLKQVQLETKDPETREFEYQALHVDDAEGHPIGNGRADYAFLKSPLYPLTFDQLTDPLYGYYTYSRRWNLTHTSGFTFVAKRDTTPPELKAVEATQAETVRSQILDVVKLTFSEPMRVAKDREANEYTQLDKDNALAIINVSKNADGSNPKAIGAGAKLQDIEFDRLDTRIVYLYYPRDTFEDQNWIEVTLGPDMRDPAGNKPGSTGNRLSGTVRLQDEEIEE